MLYEFDINEWSASNLDMIFEDKKNEYEVCHFDIIMRLRTTPDLINDTQLYADVKDEIVEVSSARVLAVGESYVHIQTGDEDHHFVCTSIDETEKPPQEGDICHLFIHHASSCEADVIVRSISEEVFTSVIADPVMDDHSKLYMCHLIQCYKKCRDGFSVWGKYPVISPVIEDEADKNTPGTVLREAYEITDRLPNTGYYRAMKNVNRELLDESGSKALQRLKYMNILERQELRNFYGENKPLINADDIKGVFPTAVFKTHPEKRGFNVLIRTDDWSGMIHRLEVSWNTQIWPISLTAMSSVDNLRGLAGWYENCDVGSMVKLFMESRTYTTEIAFLHLDGLGHSEKDSSPVPFLERFLRSREFTDEKLSPLVTFTAFSSTCLAFAYDLDGVPQRLKDWFDIVVP